ncbi:hypothetical protein QQS21_002871 [Conoideocrella luteorostrata]|uniref:RNA-dependent RNA polymerase n=1 Tax=Conoideocrella luteorostrata TaxID=1105319 RepID=A0AAJ0FW62_9HYPO|nr:hypothetical protein QQS21_002871 [Conoideocrella luteorostrata]
MSVDASPRSKRAKHQFSQELSETYNKIDAIPSRSSRSPYKAKNDLSFDVADNARLLFQDFSSSFSSSAPSQNTSFSTLKGISAGSSNNTSFTTNDPIDAEDGQSEYFSSHEILSDTETGSEKLQPRCEIPEHFEKRLKDVFPRSRNGNFDNVPLAVIWEANRYASHCSVDIGDIDIHYCNYTSYREFLSSMMTHDTFSGKQPPPPTSEAVWEAALKTFQSGTDGVVMSGTLVPVKRRDGPLFHLKLNPLRLDKSNRIFRRFGSDRFLVLKIPSTSDLQRITKCGERLKKEYIGTWLTRRGHYFLGRQWSAFFYKAEKEKSKKHRVNKDEKRIMWYKVFFFACSGDMFRKSPNGSLPAHDAAANLAQRQSVSLDQLVKWMIGDFANSSQQLPKLYSRISLSLSDTVPTVVLEKHQIYHAREDIGSQMVMNDGIGRLSITLAQQIALCLGLARIPSAFQARFGSAKGVWLVDRNEPPPLGCDDWIVTYPSQRKWDCSQDDAAHRTFEVITYSSEVRSASLNLQFIPLLLEQAVNKTEMAETIKKHLHATIRDDLSVPIDAMSNPVELRGWLGQSHGSSADDNARPQEPLGGRSYRLKDSMAAMVDLGYTPKNNELLKINCQSLVNDTVEALEGKMNIKIPCSAYVLMAVDFSGTLAEDEVHLSFSTSFEVDGFCDTMLEGMDVLVGRVPAHLPSDIQRVKVVSNPHLRHIKDVIIFSIQGKRPLADKLSGGDYDGDRVLVNWDQSFVQNFGNAHMPEKQPDLVELELVKKLDLPMSKLKRKYKTDEDICAEFMYEGTSFNMGQSMLGICTKYKDNYCRLIGSVTSPKITRISMLLGLLVDQEKQGYVFANHDWQTFLKLHGLPLFIPEETLGTKVGEKKHIIDDLRDELEAVIEQTREKLDENFETPNGMWYDPDLTKRFNHYDTRYHSEPDWVKLRNKLQQDIDHLAERWKSLSRGENGEPFTDRIASFYPQWQQIQPPAELRTSKFVQMLLEDGSTNPHISNWELLKASCAIQRRTKHSSLFVWYMSAHQLLHLKQQASSERITGVIPEVYAALRPNWKYIARLRANRTGEAEEMP